MKKSISIFAHSLITVIILCSSSSFSFSRTDSARFKNDDKIMVVKISMPSRQMLRKSDMEMHRNMITSVRDAGHISISNMAMQVADKEINNEFYNGYLLSVTALPGADQEINAWFQAEQLSHRYHEMSFESDEMINNQFSQEN